MSRRAVEAHGLRQQAVKIILQAPDRRAARTALAGLLQVTKRTLRRWVQRWRPGELVAKVPGPEAFFPSREERQKVVRSLRLLGGGAGVATLRETHKEIPYRFLAWMKRRFVESYRRAQKMGRCTLWWERPGGTWAMDFTKPKATLPGGAKCLFMVRDLSSGNRLAWEPCRGERSSEVIETLKALFVQHGAPLLIKHDGGPGFRAKATQAFLREHGVRSLMSPPRMPSYNGSIERSLGWAKKRIAHMAMLMACTGAWTRDAIDTARDLANDSLRPWGALGPTPLEVFTRRRRITRYKRWAFNLTVARHEKRARKTHLCRFGTMPTARQRIVMQRRAVRDAAIKHGLLTIRRGRLSTPLS